MYVVCFFGDSMVSRGILHSTYHSIIETHVLSFNCVGSSWTDITDK